MPEVKDYLNLVTPWHSTRPRFMATVATSVQPYVLLQRMLAQLPFDFDIDTAVGVQLDAVGVRVGRSRNILTPIPNVFFSFGIEGLGFGQGVWKGPFDATEGVTRLDDDHYRLLLRAKVAANAWDGTNEHLQTLLDQIFSAADPGLQTYLFSQDNQDGTFIIAISGKLPSALALAIITGGYVPIKPAGTRVSFVKTSVDSTPLFGFGVDNQYIGGFGRGAWGVPANGN